MYEVHGMNHLYPAASSSALFVFDLFVSSAWLFSKLSKKPRSKMRWEVLIAAGKLKGPFLGTVFVKCVFCLLRANSHV